MWFFRKGHLYDKTAIQVISSRQHSVHSDYKHSTRAELMEYDDPIVENDSEFMETERDMDLMHGYRRQSGNDFESEHVSDIEYMNDELSDKAEHSFYRGFDNTFSFIAVL